MHVTLCIPLLIEGLVQGLQPRLHPRVPSLRERIKETDRTHRNKIRRPVGRWKRGKVKRKACPLPGLCTSSGLCPSPPAQGEGRLCSWQGAGRELAGSWLLVLPAVPAQPHSARGIAGREAGAGLAALLLFHHSSAANGRD